MSIASNAIERLQEIVGLDASTNVPLSRYTRFGIGGPATLLCESKDVGAFNAALQIVRDSSLPHTVIAGGTNLIVSDSGFSGAVLRFTGALLEASDREIVCQAGIPLQQVVDKSISLGFRGMETMTGIPGSLGGAIYGNAGAYGNSIQERVEQVTFTDGGSVMRVFKKDECEFDYRESIFKRHKDWVILSAVLRFEAGEARELQMKADEIRRVRDAKYPPAMKCAGSIFKNCFLRDLPPAVQSNLPANVVREGKVPSAWFLEQVGAKGTKLGGICVADYHANLIYNAGHGIARDLVTIIEDLKLRVRERYGFELREEVQYLGFE